MRSLVMAALVTVGCGSSGAGTTESCVDMSKAVSQRHGACKIPSNSGVGFGGCPALSDAYCQPDGLLSSCPSGWNTNCEMTGANCTYGDSTACVPAGGDATYAFVQTLDGIDGLSVLTGTTDCIFVACK